MPPNKNPKNYKKRSQSDATNAGFDGKTKTIFRLPVFAVSNSRTVFAFSHIRKTRRLF